MNLMSRYVTEFAMCDTDIQFIGLIDKNANGVSANLLVRNAWVGESGIRIWTLTARPVRRYVSSILKDPKALGHCKEEINAG